MSVFVLLLASCEANVKSNTEETSADAGESLSVEATETIETQSTETEIETNNDTEGKSIDHKSLEDYSFSFYSYFHDPYDPGDELNALYVTEVALFNAIIYRDEFDFVTDGPDLMSIRISKPDLQELANAIFPGNYTVTDKYFDSYKNYYDAPLGRTWALEAFIYGGPVLEHHIVEENDSYAVVSFTVKTEEDPNITETLLYTFDKVDFHGVKLYKIREIKK